MLSRVHISSFIALTVGAWLLALWVQGNGLEPYAYLHHVLQHIAAADTLEKIEALLPWNMK